jgi:hypothetical protein
MNGEMREINADTNHGTLTTNARPRPGVRWIQAVLTLGIVVLQDVQHCPGRSHRRHLPAGEVLELQ